MNNIEELLPQHTKNVKPYERIPYSKNSSSCLGCHKELKISELCQFVIETQTGKKVVSYPLLFCADCQLPLANKDIRIAIRNEFGGHIFLSNSKKPDKDKLLEIIFTPFTSNQPHPQKEKGTDATTASPSPQEKERLALAKRLGFSLVDYSHIKQTPSIAKRLFTYRTSKSATCPQCSSLLKEREVFIILSQIQHQAIATNCFVCEKCTTFFAYGSNWRYLRLLSNDYEPIIITPPSPAKLAHEKFNSIPHAAVLIETTDKSGQYKPFIIVNKPTYAAEKSGRYFYTHEAARELLAAVFIPQKNRNAIINGVVYHVDQHSFSSVSQNSLDRYIPTEWYIKKNGGYFSKDLNDHIYLVDILVYSPTSKRYEVVKATYDENLDLCYSDIQHYRSFVYNHGKPPITFSLPPLDKKGNGLFDQLIEKSVLKEWGYEVNKAKGLSDTERHDILGEIVDLEILDVRQIINRLEFFIFSHSGDQYIDARNKWNNDITFLQNYKVNTQRFIIAQNCIPRKKLT